MTRCCIYFKTNNPATVRRIRERFGMSQVGMTVNGEQVAEIKDEDMDVLRQTEAAGYIQIRDKNV